MTSRKLRIESLEARTLLAVTAGFAETAAPLAAPIEAIPWVVNTTKDPAKWSETDAEVSLREAIDRAAEGDVITFDSSLAGGTIVLYGKQLGIAKGITIDAFSVGGMTINGNSKTRVFNISGGTEEAPVELLGLTITGGSGLTGGGIYCSGVLNLTNCNILANAASNRGGGIYEASGTLTLTNCAVTDNSAADVGGGIFENGGILTYTNCTVASNTAETGGGGLYHRAGETNLFNTIIVQNSTDISRNSGSVNGYDCLTTYTAWSNSDGDNLVYESWMTLFADADSCDYSLVKDSVAVNRGNNAYIEGHDVDLVGNPRIVGSVVDLGADECQETISWETPSTVVTTGLDIVDYSDNMISLREAISYAEEGDTITFDSSLADVTITLEKGELLIDKGISIDASSVGGVTIDGNSSSRIFEVTGGTESVPVSFIALDITGGNADKGGGIYSTAGVVLNLTDCAVYGNTASLRGGGICKNSGSLTLTNCLITDNAATNAGGGIYKDSGTLTLINCTVAENTTTKAGGGIYHYGGETELYNTIVAQNSADITQYMKQDVYQGTISGYNSLSSYTGWTSSLNCLEYDPSRPLFADAANGDYTLAAIGNSQAIDKGNNDYISGCETDLAGNPRIYDNGTVDIGAYECQFNLSDLEAASTVVTTILDVVDPTDNRISLREAISYAAADDTVTFDSSLTLTSRTITLVNGQLCIDKDITIDASDVGGVTIDADGNSRVFYVSGGTADTPVELISLTVTGGYVNDEGGGIFNESTLTLTNCAVTGNSANLGGGICGYEGTLTLTGCTVAENTASYQGGGICSYEETLTLTGCVITGNSANHYEYSEDEYGGGYESCVSGVGGGIYCSGVLSLTDCEVSGNTAGEGGGICSAVSATLADCVISGNSAWGYSYSHFEEMSNFYAYGYGGGMSNTGELTITNCVISGNSAADFYREADTCYIEGLGGGIINHGTLMMINSVISDNSVRGTYHGEEYSSGGKGGGIDSDGVLVLTNSTLSGNTADNYGGGIYNEGGTARLCNTIVALNTAAQSGNDIYNDLYYEEESCVCACNTLSSFTEWDESSYCLTYDPLQPLFVGAADGNYALAKNSQAIDEGNNDYISGYDTDLAGNPRIANGIVDLGAYEYQDGFSPEQLAAPAILTGNRRIYVSYGVNRHQITWDAIEHASGYELAYSAGGSSWTTVSADDSSAVITGLTYGADMQYRVRALGDGVSYTNSDWSAVKTFKVCPMDIDGDGDIAGGDRVLMVDAWLSGEGDDEFLYAADINGDGDITGADRAFLSNNWLLNVFEDADDLVYPPAKVSDAVFAQLASADLNTDLGVF